MMPILLRTLCIQYNQYGSYSYGEVFTWYAVIIVYLAASVICHTLI